MYSESWVHIIPSMFFKFADFSADSDNFSVIFLSHLHCKRRLIKICVFNQFLLYLLCSPHDRITFFVAFFVAFSTKKATNYFNLYNLPFVFPLSMSLSSAINSFNSSFVLVSFNFRLSAISAVLCHSPSFNNFKIFSYCSIFFFDDFFVAFS